MPTAYGAFARVSPLMKFGLTPLAEETSAKEAAEHQIVVGGK